MHNSALALYLNLNPISGPEDGLREGWGTWDLFLPLSKVATLKKFLLLSTINLTLNQSAKEGPSLAGCDLSEHGVRPSHASDVTSPPQANPFASTFKIHPAI